MTFSNFDGGSPTSDEFNADAYLDGLEKLASTRRDVGERRPARRQLAHALESIDRFRSQSDKIRRDLNGLLAGRTLGRRQGLP